MRLASNYSKLFEIATIWIKFRFEYLWIALGIQIEKNLDLNSDIQLKLDYLIETIGSILIEIDQFQSKLIK